MMKLRLDNNDKIKNSNVNNFGAFFMGVRCAVGYLLIGVLTTEKNKEKLHRPNNYGCCLVIADMKGKAIPVTGRGGP
jgi:hypothetical protein